MSLPLKHITPKQAVIVWVVLVISTIGIGWLGDHHAAFGEWTIPIVMVVALIKARAIIMYYMEVQIAPLKLRIPFELWVSISFGIILGGWFFL
ncbi:hypothetical protein AltI4_26400 [Alteromonas sp. I4]|nr:hypothetical protein AltI4_26400 [Alteromonas sp. I4]